MRKIFYVMSIPVVILDILQMHHKLDKRLTEKSTESTLKGFHLEAKVVAS